MANAEKINIPDNKSKQVVFFFHLGISKQKKIENML